MTAFEWGIAMEGFPERRAAFLAISLCACASLGCFAPPARLSIDRFQQREARIDWSKGYSVETVLADRSDRIFPPGFDPATSPFEQALLPAMAIDEEFARMALEVDLFPASSEADDTPAANWPDDDFRRSSPTELAMVEPATPTESEPAGPKAWLGVPAQSTGVIARGSAASTNRVIGSSLGWVSAAVRSEPTE